MKTEAGTAEKAPQSRFLHDVVLGEKAQGSAGGAAAGRTAVGTAACGATAAAAQDAAADDGDDSRRDARRNSDNLTADRSGEGGNEFVPAIPQLLDAVLSGLKPADDQRLIQLQTAACTQAEGFPAGVARAGDAQLEGAWRAALLAACLKDDLVDDQRAAVFAPGAGIIGRIAADGVQPTAVRTARLGTAAPIGPSAAGICAAIPREAG